MKLQIIIENDLSGVLYKLQNYLLLETEVYKNTYLGIDEDTLEYYPVFKEKGYRLE